MPDSEKKLKRVVLKEELIALTGDWLKALILNQFLYWGKRRKEFDAFILEERLRIADPNIELTHGWIWKSVKELAEEIMVKPLSDDTINRRIAEIVESGWLEQRRNPKHKWDRTYQYRPAIRKIQSDLQALGFALEGYPLLIENSAIPQDAESEPQDAEMISPDAESNLDGAEALPETTTETPTKITGREGAAKKTPPARDYLTDVFNHQQASNHAGIADPSSDPDRWLHYRGEALQAYKDLAGMPADDQVGKPAISALAAESGFDLERWRKAISTCRLGGVRPGNIACMIDTYRAGGDYSKMHQKGTKGNGHAPNHNSTRVHGRIPAYSVADPAGWHDKPPDDDTG